MATGRDTLDEGASGVRLSVVVPATDAPPTLERCLGALAASDRPPTS